MSHEEWLSDWQGARSGEFFVLGSRDETADCQLCVASIADDGSLTLRLRMPDCLAGAKPSTPPGTASADGKDKDGYEYRRELPERATGESYRRELPERATGESYRRERIHK